MLPDDARQPDSTPSPLPAGQPPAPAARRSFWERIAPRVTAPLWILTGIALVWTAKYASIVVVPVVAAVVLATILSPLARVLETWARLPKTPAALIPLLGAVFVLVGTLVLLVPATDQWQDRLPSLVQEAEYKLWRVTSVIKDVKEVTEQVEKAAGNASGNGEGDRVEKVVVAEEQGMFSELVSNAPADISRSFITLVLAFFLLRERQDAVRAVMSLVRRHSTRLDIARFARTARRNVAEYFLTICAINAGVGVVTGLSLYAIGLPGGAVWGGAMAIANFIPFLGPTAIIAISFAVGLVSFPTLEEAFVAPAVVLLINTIEANIVMPTLVGRRFYISPVVVLIAVLFGAWLWGVVGAVLAVPLTVIAMTGIDTTSRKYQSG